MPELRQTAFNEVPGAPMSSPNEPHMACVLLLDTSGSMYGEPIRRLNEAVSMFKEQTCMDELAKKRIDVAVIEFNDEARVVQDFVPLTQLQPVNLEAIGCTAMGKGINLAIDKVKERTHLYSTMGTPRLKPWIFMISDGAPTDDISAARERIIEEESKGSNGRLKFWAIGVPGYSKEILTSLTKRCIALDEANFTGIFNWLSESMVRLSDSEPGGAEPQLPMLPANAQVIPSDW